MVRICCLFNLASVSSLATDLFNIQKTSSHHLRLSVFKRNNILHLNIVSERLNTYWKGHLGHQRCLQYQSNAINIISDSTRQCSLYRELCYTAPSMSLQCWPAGASRWDSSLNPTCNWSLISSERQLARTGYDIVLSWLQLLLSGHLSVRNWNEMQNQLCTNSWPFSSTVTASHQTE